MWAGRAQPGEHRPWPAQVFLFLVVLSEGLRLHSLQSGFGLQRAEVFDAKRLIGRKFQDPIVQADMKLWPFKVEAGTGDKPLIVVTVEGQETSPSHPQGHASDPLPHRPA